MEYYVQPNKKGLPYTQQKERRLTGHVFSWNCLLKQVIGGKLEGRVEMAR
jgi:hypothetical protein